MSERSEAIPSASRPQLEVDFPGLAGHQVWSDLFFIHWRVPPERVEPFIPRGLTLDVLDGSAWVGIVPFQMSGVRPWWSPSLPGLSRFLETNLRTYVHDRGRNPGVYFLSLEAANRIAVTAARLGWHLPYHHARMSVLRDGGRFEYRSHRAPCRPESLRCDITATVGPPLNSGHPDGRSGIASPGSLEEFLVERYLLYTRSPTAGLLRGHVRHAPYPLYEASLERIDQTLTRPWNWDCSGPPDHVLFSPGVTVNVSRLIGVAP